jgi:PPM family protein phosphatase
MADAFDNDLLDITLRLLRGGIGRRPTSNQSYPFSLSSDLGLVRESNQDRLIAFRAGPWGSDSPFACVAISDGMGGMVDGEACAILTVATFAVHLIAKRRVPLSERLDAAARAANEAVFRHASGRGGATLSALVFDAYGHIWFVNVGDSRIYAVTQDRREVERLTIDDTMEEAFGGHGRDLVQFVGIGEGLLPRVGQVPAGLDTLMATTDGVHFMPQELFSKVALEAGDPRRSADRLIALSRWLGGPDNASIAACRPAEVIADLRDSPRSLQLWTQSDAVTLLLPPSGQAVSVEPTKAAPLVSEGPARQEKADRKPKPKAKRDRSKRPEPKQAPQADFL